MTAKKCGVNNCNKSPQGLSSILEASEVKGQAASLCVCVWTVVCHISAPGLGVKYARIENLGKYFCPRVRARESVARQSIEEKKPTGSSLPRILYLHTHGAPISNIQNSWASLLVNSKHNYCSFMHVIALFRYIKRVNGCWVDLTFPINAYQPFYLFEFEVDTAREYSCPVLLFLCPQSGCRLKSLYSISPHPRATDISVISE